MSWQEFRCSLAVAADNCTTSSFRGWCNFTVDDVMMDSWIRWADHVVACILSCWTKKLTPVEWGNRFKCNLGKHGHSKLKLVHGPIMGFSFSQTKWRTVAKKFLFCGRELSTIEMMWSLDKGVAHSAPLLRSYANSVQAITRKGFDWKACVTKTNREAQNIYWTYWSRCTTWLVLWLACGVASTNLMHLDMRRE
jgi:hypothetical protein